MKKIVLKELSIYDDVKIMGHVFHGLKDVAEAVSFSGSVSATGNPSLFRRRKPLIVIPNLYVCEIWESYPCFDSSDSLYENRRYQNYFFSALPFTPSTVRDIISQCRPGSNYQYINEFFPPEFTPAIYYVGEWGKMILATLG